MAIMRQLSDADLAEFRALAIYRRSTLDTLHEWLIDRGYQISRNAISNFRRQLRTDGSRRQWLTIDQASKLHGVCPGQMRRLCLKQFFKRGLARKVKTNTTKAKWHVRADAMAKHGAPNGIPELLELSSLDAPAIGSIQIRIGAITITIETGVAPVVPSLANARREAFKRPSKVV
jgi:hypothetical protein